MVRRWPRPRSTTRAASAAARSSWSSSTPRTQSPDVMKTVMQNLVSQNVAAIFMPFCSYTSVEFPIIANQKVPVFHVNTWHGNVDWVAEHQAYQHLPGRPQRAVLWVGHRGGRQRADRLGRLQAPGQDGVRRHLERPVQPEYRPELPDVDHDEGWDASASRSSPCRRRTGAARWSTSARPSRRDRVLRTTRPATRRRSSSSSASRRPSRWSTSSTHPRSPSTCSWPATPPTA